MACAPRMDSWPWLCGTPAPVERSCGIRRSPIRTWRTYCAAVRRRPSWLYWTAVTLSSGTGRVISSSRATSMLSRLMACTAFGPARSGRKQDHRFLAGLPTLPARSLRSLERAFRAGLRSCTLTRFSSSCVPGCYALACPSQRKAASGRPATGLLPATLLHLAMCASNPSTRPIRGGFSMQTLRQFDSVQSNPGSARIIEGGIWLRSCCLSPGHRRLCSLSCCLSVTGQFG
jgi:hypothetical protein